MSKYDLASDDFVIILRPSKDADGKWDGAIDLRLANCVDDFSTLTEDEVKEMKMQTALVAASLPAMHQDITLYDELMHIATEYMSPVEEESDDEDSAVQVKRNGNVYTLSFNSKTEGSA